MRNAGKSGKKLPEAIAEVLAMFPTSRPLRVMYQDEARFGRISDTRYCWAKKPTRPEVKGMLIYQYTYAYAAVSPQDGRMDSLVLPEVSSRCMQIFLDEVAQRYPDDNIVMIVDGAGWHKSNDLKLPENLRLLFLPPCSPELNPQEHLWDELREKYFHNRAFDSLGALENQLVAGLRALEADHARVKSIAGWEYIINSISNAI
ncbi:MAG: IS630 family transposase [Acidithiobacillus ferrivorans]